MAANANKSIAAVCVSFAGLWCLSALAAILLFPTVFENFNARIYDGKMAIRPFPSYSAEIVHVDVDDEAIQEFGQWPWDRALSAAIVQRLSEFGAKVIVLDILYASDGKSKEGDAAFFDSVKRAGNVVAATGLGILTGPQKMGLEIPEERSRADALYDRAYTVQARGRSCPFAVSKLKNSSLPLLPIIQHSGGVGFITATPGKDGVHRGVPLLVKLADRYVPSLSLATLVAYWGLAPDSLFLTDNNNLEIKRGSDVITIPTDARGMLLVNWGEMWRSFKRCSVKDILSRAPDPSIAALCKDKIVIVAATMTGNTDSGATPVSVSAPLSRLHSHALNTMLTRNFIWSVPVFPWIIAVSILLALLFAATAPRLSVKTAGLALGSILLGAALASAFGFFLWSYEVPLSEALLIFLPAASGSLLIKGVATERQADEARRALERYLPPEFLEQTLSRGISPDVSTRRQEMTIVFVDMEGFSTLSESVEVEYVSRFLKDFFGRMTTVVLHHQGRIHQFLGDGFLAVFGDIVPLEHHADAAVTAALEMQQQMAALNAGWVHSGIREFEKGMRMRIGMSTGMVLAGDLGADRRLEYAIVGTTVNIASRLQSLAPAGGIMMTARTRALVQNPAVCEGPQYVRPKGFDRDLEVYSIHPDPSTSFRRGSHE